MFITKLSVDRRTFLRGIGASLALPLLEAMTPALAMGTAKAVGKVPRLGFIYSPNGMNMTAWTPTGTGREFVFGPSMQGLEPFRQHVNVLTGLCHHQADRMNDGAGDHSRATAVFLSGAHAKRTQGADLFVGVTADQIAARSLGKDTPLPSLELAIDNADRGPVCDEGYTCAYMNTLSWSTPSTPLPVEVNPRLVFERLFGEGGSAKERVLRIREDRSILDSVRPNVAKLQLALGAPDRRRIDQYLQSIREVEQRLQRVETQNVESPAAGADGTKRPVGVPDNFEDHVKLMFDLQVLAYQADITRVITFMLGREVGGRSYPQIGVPEGHHGISHHEDVPEKLAKVAKIDAYHLHLLAYFLEKLRTTPDGDGSLLDQVMILYGSGISNGNLHSHDNLPVLLAGGGAGQLQGGRHLKYAEHMTMSNLLLSLLDKAQARTDRLGDSSGLLAEL
jgi:hypothetical protein